MTRIQRLTLLTVALLAAVALAPGAAWAADVEKADHNAAAGTAAHDGEVKANLLRGGSEGIITAITTLIVFLGLVVVLGKYAWGPIASGLKAREDKIRQ